jgi:TonB family protein
MLRGLKGDAKVRFEIDPSGKARMLSADSPKSKYFASYAAVAIADWKIKPAMKQGVPVPVECAVIFRYD